MEFQATPSESALSPFAFDSLIEFCSYINFAHGDESLENIYGASLPRLQALKKVYDPQNRFNQWFPLA